MQTTKCTSFGQEKFRLIMALAQSIKKYWNSILPGRLGLCGQVTPPIILKIWLMVEKMSDQSNSGTEHGNDVILVDHAHRRTLHSKTQNNLQNKK